MWRVCSGQQLKRTAVKLWNLLYTPPGYKDHLVIKTTFYRSQAVYFLCNWICIQRPPVYKGHVLLVPMEVLYTSFTIFFTWMLLTIFVKNIKDVEMTVPGDQQVFSRWLQVQFILALSGNKGAANKKCDKLNLHIFISWICIQFKFWKFSLE